MPSWQLVGQAASVGSLCQWAVGLCHSALTRHMDPVSPGLFGIWLSQLAEWWCSVIWHCQGIEFKQLVCS